MPAAASKVVQHRVIAPLRRALQTALQGRPETLLAGVSGGPDSLCLLHGLAQLRRTLPIRLHVAHLDHGLRGQAGADDAAFVRETCRALDIPCTTERRSVSEYQATHPEVTSVEAAARNVRYSFFHDVAAAIGAAAAVTGHTLDDQAETVLMHLIRGAGSTGLRGMQADSIAQTEAGPLRVLRPLLGVSRAATPAYCRSAGLHPRDDETNQSLDFTRNRTRLHVLPVLQQLNPKVVDALAQLAVQAQQDHAYWDAEVARTLAEFGEPFQTGLLLDRRRLRSKPAALVTRVLRRAAIAVTPNAEISFDHSEALQALVNGSSGKLLWLPGIPLYALATYAHLLLVHEPLNLGSLPQPLPVAGVSEQRWGPWQVTLGPMTAATSKGHWQTPLTEEQAGRAHVGHRVPGQRYGHRKLQDALVDAGCPELLRDHLPVLTDSEGTVLWVAGLGPVASPPRSGSGPGTFLQVRPADRLLEGALRLWEGRSYNDEAR
ncbi:MAG: tRNA lysidine(34) synthetase TilS [Dehalococcoidia bacterium]|nr:tRNA lysidine(34) synthetase TilS [Dehalococcoidia bacterium]